MRRGWKSTTPQRVSAISWSTDRLCTATPRLVVRSHRRTSSRSAATCRSAIGCGHRSPAIPATPRTATSTPTTTPRASNRHGLPAAMSPLTPKRPTTRNAPTTRSTATLPISSSLVRQRLISESERIGRPAHVIAAFDTELFGHWWYEGPVWLERVLRALPEAGVRVGTLSDAVADGFVGSSVELPPSSWGSGKDWQVWSGETGGRSGPIEQRSRRYRADDGGQGAR